VIHLKIYSLKISSSHNGISEEVLNLPTFNAKSPIFFKASDVGSPYSSSSSSKSVKKMVLFLPTEFGNSLSRKLLICSSINSSVIPFFARFFLYPTEFSQFDITTTICFQKSSPNVSSQALRSSIASASFKYGFPSSSNLIYNPLRTQV